MDSLAKPRKGPVRRFFSSLGRSILTLMFIGIIAGSIVVSVLALYIFNSLEGAPNVDLKDIKDNLSNSSYIYASDPQTKEWKKVYELYSGENREWIDYEKIPRSVVDVTVAAEDKRYWDHHGVDWIRTVASTITFFTGQEQQGGSTITQQVIKNMTNHDEITPERKVQEIFTALKMNRNFTKEEVLEAYLNIAFFSNHCNGIQSASKLYFGKDVSELNVAEIATIIAITNAPTKYNPYRESPNLEKGWGTGMQENKVRRSYILGEMLKMNTLTQAEFEKWDSFDVQLADRASQTASTSTIDKPNNWFIDQVQQDVISDLVKEKNMTQAAASRMILSGGYRIYCTMDENVQKSLEASYAEPKTFPPVNNKVYPETAAIVIAPDGSVQGMMGGNKKEANRIMNRATMAVRHPGSTMKPISAYLNAFERDLITWSTTYIDEPMTLTEKGETFEWPNNYSNTYTHEPMTVQYAVMKSINTVPAKIVNLLTPQVCYDTLKNKFQISTLDPMDAVSTSSMALGGMTYGMTPLELVGCYQIFVTGGKYVKPYTYTKVTDMAGNIVLEKDTTQVRVVSEETASVLNRLLQTVATAGTGAASNLKNETGIATAGKTGSSTGTKWVNGQEVDIDNPDLWYIGLTPYYISGVWMGYDMKEEIRYSTYPTPKLWKNLMLPIHKGLPAKDFEYSPKVKSMSYCTISGDLASDYCKNKAVGWYKETYIPSVCVQCRSGISVEELPEDSGSDGPKVIKKEEDSDDGADTNKIIVPNSGYRPKKTEDSIAEPSTDPEDAWGRIFN